MATQVQLRGGTTSEHSSFTGAAREVTVDTDKDVVVVHDGSTAGGIPLAKEASVLPLAGGALTGAVTTTSTFDGRNVSVDGGKLDAIEASADVTDTTNVTAAGALMDSEVTNLAQVKAFDTTDYATSTQGTTADNALPKAGGTMTGALTVPEIAVSGTVDGVDVSSIPSDITGISYQSANINVFPNQNLDLTGAGSGYKGNYSGMSGWALNSNHQWDFQILFTSPNAVTAANRTQEDRDLWEDGFGRGAPTHYSPSGLKVIRVSMKKLNANNNWTMFPSTLSMGSSSPWTVSCLHRYVSGTAIAGGGWKTGETTGTWQRNVYYNTTTSAGAYWHLHPSWAGATGDEAVFDLCTFVVLSGKVPPERIGHHAMHPYGSSPWVY